MNETGYSFGQRLSQLRQSAGLSQQMLADQLSVTRQAVSNWERDQTLPDLDMLRSIACALGTDLNTLGGGSAAPAQKRRASRSLWAGVLVICLCGASFLGGYLTKREILASNLEPAQMESVKEMVQSSSLAPHEIQYTTPSGITVTTAADGRLELAELLTALPDMGTGPVEITEELADTFRYFAGQYELCLAPNYEYGNFLSWDQALFWLYKIDVSGGGIMTEEQVDAAVADFFGGAVSYKHQSTEHFLLTEEGYYPENVTTYAGETYRLTSLNKLEDGIYEAVLREGSGSAIAVTLILDGESVQFRGITRSDADKI